MKVNSKQVYHGIIDLIPGTDEKTYILATGRPGGVLEIVLTAINARGVDKMQNVNRVLKINGVECDLDAPRDIGHPQAYSWSDPIYIADGQEYGLRIDGEKVGSTCRVLIHWIWHKDGNE